MALRTLLSTALFLLVAISVQSQQQEKNVPDSLHTDSIFIYEIKETITDNLPVVSLDDNDFSDAGSQNISSLLTAGRDPFYNAASFNFSPARFRIRGYDADMFEVYMNGIPTNSLDNGLAPFALWGGLNDVMRNRDVSQGLRFNTFAYGNFGGATNIDARASKQRKQTSFSYAISNRNYSTRWMITHSTGVSKKGWSFSFSGGQRWAEEGYVPGTYYHNYSAFIAADKKFGLRNLLSFVAFASPNESGRAGAATAEMFDLASTNYYNPYWGYQNGKKRNASVAKTLQPVFILTHEFRINDKTSIITAAGYSFGKRSISGLDWYNAPDPRPDYYNYLPSAAKDEMQREAFEETFRSDENAMQINWQNLYNVNRDSWQIIQDANGITGNDVYGHRSRYVLTERVNDVRKLYINSVFNARTNNHIDLMGGLSYQTQTNNFYQQLNDLLGGDFYVDLNQFAERDFPNDPNANQNNIDHPNRIVYKGDKYGYNYTAKENKVKEWIQAVFRFNNVDLFLAGNVSYTEFWRFGNVRNGLFPDNSYGASQPDKFLNYATKAGITYKINGRNYISINGSYGTRAPYFDNVFVSPKTRDVQQENVTSEIIKSAEAAYLVNAPRYKIHISGYYTKFENGMDVLSFYHDQFRSFVNYSLSNINKVHFGTEVGIEATVMRNVTFTTAASIGRYYFDSRQHAIVTLDNNASVLDEQTIYSTNYRVPSTPQEAYSCGFTYRSPKYWFLSLTANHFDQRWLSINPIRRTEQAVEDLEKESDLRKEILQQTKLPAQNTLDFFGGYSWRLPRSFHFKKPVYLVVYAGVNNLLKNKNIISGGYEQLRFDYAERDVNKFSPKFYYAYGLNYFINTTLRF